MMKCLIGLEKSDRLFATIVMALFLLGCSRMPPLPYLKGDGAFLPTEQMLAQVNQRYPNAQLLEVRLKQGKGSPFNRNYRYEIKLMDEYGRFMRALKIDAHDGRVLNDEPFNCSLLNRCPWGKLR